MNFEEYSSHYHTGGIALKAVHPKLILFRMQKIARKTNAVRRTFSREKIDFYNKKMKIAVYV